MKKYSIYFVLMLGFLFSGCMSPKLTFEKEEKYDVVNYMLYPASYAEKGRKVNQRYNQDYSYQYTLKIYEKFKLASEETLYSGNKYFAVVNSGMSNLEGFPISNFDDLISYCFPYYEENSNFVNQLKFDKCSSMYENKLKIIMFKEEVPGIYLWDATKTWNELK